MAKDVIHEQVKRALIKNGWTITADPLFLHYQFLQNMTLKMLI